MLVNKDEFLKSMEAHGYSLKECSDLMEINRVYLWYILSGKRKPGNKFISGLSKVFPDQPVEKFLVKV